MKISHLSPKNLYLPSDKSISHRLILASLLSKSDYEIKGLSLSEDIQTSLEAVKKLGIDIEKINEGQYLFQVSNKMQISSDVIINCGNSGTTARLLLGILGASCLEHDVKLIGDNSLSKRPMSRVTDILKKSGCHFDSNDFLPITISPHGLLTPISYQLPIASAQVKSAFLLAGLQIEGETRLSGRIQSRDHTERLLSYAKVDSEVRENEITLNGPTELEVLGELNIPRDPSAAAFWCLYAALKNDDVFFSQLLLNPSRLGFYKTLEEVGAEVKIKETDDFYEPSGEMKVSFKKGGLNSFNVSENQISNIIDEVLILSVIATLGNGVSKISGVSELRYKESDRLKACIILAEALGAQAICQDDDLIISANKAERTYDFQQLVESKDHRVVMILAIISKACDIPIELKYPESVKVSYPDFWKALEQLS